MRCYNCSKEISQVTICPYCEKNQIYSTLEFNVKGTTFENENGKDIQKEIRKIYLEYEKNGCFEKYGGYTNAEIKAIDTEVAEFEDAELEMNLKEDVYEGKPYVKIYIQRYDDTYCHVGYMPKGLVKRYLKLRKNFKEIKMNITLIGGKIKQLEYDYDTENKKIEVVDLTYGFEVKLIFYNDEQKFQQEVEKNKQKAIKKWEAIKEQSNKEIEINTEKQEITVEEIYNQVQDEAQKDTENDDFRKRNQKSNIIVFLIIAIISIPFIWVLWKILSIIFWIIDV